MINYSKIPTKKRALSALGDIILSPTSRQARARAPTKKSAVKAISVATAERANGIRSCYQSGSG